MAKTPDLTADDIMVGRTYRAKRYKRFMDASNDRYVLYVSPLKADVQYDSDTVRNGRHYPRVSMEKFLRWAKEEVEKEEPVGA